MLYGIDSHAARLLSSHQLSSLPLRQSPAIRRLPPLPRLKRLSRPLRCHCRRNRRLSTPRPAAGRPCSPPASREWRHRGAWQAPLDRPRAGSAPFDSRLSKAAAPPSSSRRGRPWRDPAARPGLAGQARPSGNPATPPRARARPSRAASSRADAALTPAGR